MKATSRVCVGALLLCGVAQAQPSTPEDTTWQPVTRDIALWTHAVTGSVALIGGGYYAINGLNSNDVDTFERACAAGDSAACAKGEAEELERRTQSSMGTAMLVHALASASGLVFLSSDPSGVGKAGRSSHHALYATSAVLALGSALTMLPLFSGYQSFQDEKSSCFDGGVCDKLRQHHSDVADAAFWPILVSTVGYGVSLTTALLTPDYGVSAAPVVGPGTGGAMLSGRF